MIQTKARIEESGLGLFRLLEYMRHTEDEADQSFHSIKIERFASSPKRVNVAVGAKEALRCTEE